MDGIAGLAAPAIAAPPADSIARTVNRERLVLLGWGRAIAMQFAHPLIAAAVIDHSAFRAGRLAQLRRLHGTVSAMLSLTFGSEAQIRATAGHINAIHDRVHGVLREAAGPFPAGTPYSAHDPALVQWVLATLLESLPLAYARFVTPLSPAEEDRYCREASRLGLLFGLPESSLPQSMDAVRDLVRTRLASGEIVVSSGARTLMQAILYPPFHLALWPATRVTRLATIGLLDPQLRAQYGLTWTARDARTLDRWTRRIHRLHAIAPDRLRYWPETVRE